MKFNNINADMTKGNLWKQMLIFSLPLILSNLVQVLFNMADLAVVGRFCGANALGSVGSTSILVNLFIGFIIGVSGGINVLVARAKGAKNGMDASNTVLTSFFLSLVLGLLLSAIGIGFSKILLDDAMNTKPDLLNGALLYFRIFMLGMPALTIFNWGNAVLSSVGETKKPLYFLSIAGVLNVILNIIFVLCFGMSTDGVAFATIISQYVSATLVVCELVRTKDEDIKLCFSKFKIGAKKVKELAAICLPSGLQNAIFFFANIFVQIGVNSFDTVMVAGNSAASNADGIVYDVMAAIYVAISSFVGQNYGAGNKKRVLKSFFVGMVYSVLAGLILGVGLVIFGNGFLSLFVEEKHVIDAGMQKLVVMGLSYWISAFMDGTIAASRGLGRSVVPMYIVFGGSCVFRLLWIFTVFEYFGTIESLYLLYSASWTITAVAEIIYFVYVFKKDIKNGLMQ